MNLKRDRTAVSVRAPVLNSAAWTCLPPALVYNTNIALHLPFPGLGLRVATEGSNGESPSLERLECAHVPSGSHESQGKPTYVAMMLLLPDILFKRQ